MSHEVFRVSGLEARRGARTVLAGIDLTLERGEVLALAGPNGAGKTTFLHVLAGLLPPSGGEFVFLGRRVPRELAPAALRRRTALVFQDQLLLSGSVRFNLEVGLAIRGVPRGERQRRSQHWLEIFGLEELADRPARALSGGEAQRVNLARAFTLAPELLLLDEPFAGLDAPARGAAEAGLERALAESGATAVLVTHDADEIRNLAARAGVLLGGSMVQVGTPSRLYESPRSPAVARFLGLENLLEGLVEEVDGARVLVGLAGGLGLALGPADTVADGFSPARGTPVTLRLRPAELALGRQAGDRGWPGRITAVRTRGELWAVEIATAAGRLEVLLRRRERDALGDEGIFLGIPPGAAHLMPAG